MQPGQQQQQFQQQQPEQAQQQPSILPLTSANVAQHTKEQSRPPSLQAAEAATETRKPKLRQTSCQQTDRSKLKGELAWKLTTAVQNGDTVLNVLQDLPLQR